MSSLELFLPLTKVDLDQRLVTGIATAETPDRSGEICDYASSRPYFEKWSAEALAASGGKSLGAVRAMHGHVAAGKLTDIAFDDDGKRIVIAAKIVDDDEWRKVCEGVYTGFSQGGRYVKRWPDPDNGLTRYTAEPREISLVDLPCLPNATFEVVKNGFVEKRAFAALAGTSELTTSEASFEASQRAVEQPSRRNEAAAETSSVPAPAASAETPEALAKATASLAQAARAIGLVAEENAALRKALDGLAPALADLTKRVATIEAQPLPAKAALRAIAKSADGGAQIFTGVDEALRALAALPPQERALALTKLSLANPLPPRF